MTEWEMPAYQSSISFSAISRYLWLLSLLIFFFLFSFAFAIQLFFPISTSALQKWMNVFLRCFCNNFFFFFGRSEEEYTPKWIVLLSNHLLSLIRLRGRCYLMLLSYFILSPPPPYFTFYLECPFAFLTYGSRNFQTVENYFSFSKKEALSFLL